MNKFDLHLHSKYSADALPKPESISRETLRKGLKGFAITDHCNTGAFKEFKQLQKKDKNLLVVFGEEVKILENERFVGELLCYFLQEEIKPASFEEIIDNAKKQNALVSIAHPFDFSRNGFEKDLGKEFRKVQAIEAFNARAYTASANDKALDFAEKHSFPFTAGSDAHSLQEVGKAGLECNASSEEELRKAILKRKCTIFSNGLIPKTSQLVCSIRARLNFK